MKHEKIIVSDPSNNFNLLAEFEASTTEEIDSKVKLSREAFAVWSQISLSSRIKVLQKLFGELQKRKDDIARAISKEMGMPITVCMEIDINVGLAFMQDYLKHAPSWLKPEVVYESYKEKHTTYFDPFGVVAVSVPWNYPFTNFIWAAIQNLVAGNTVVVKHSEYCMLATKIFEQAFEAANVPAGLCSFVYGKGHDVGNCLMHSDVDKIWFTGSTATGGLVYKIAAERGLPVILELGGSAAAVVFDDMDLDKIIPVLYFYRFLNSGQTCDGLKRLIVHVSIFDQVVEKLADYIAMQKVGSATQKDTVIGPLVNQKQLECLEEQLRDAISKGARIIIGGKRPSGLQGAYFEPTILTGVTRDMEVWRQEVFGPILPIVSFETEAQAIEKANDSVYGLGGYIFTMDDMRAARVAAALKTGNISINGANYVVATDPFGGSKKSGIGLIHGKIGMQSLCQAKTVAALKNTWLVKFLYLISKK